MESTQAQPKSARAVLRGTIWGMAGALYGVVFLLFLGYLQHSGDSIWHPALAAGVAGAVIATFYSAKRVAIMGVFVGSNIALVYVTMYSGPPQLLHVVPLAAVAGFVIGLPVSSVFERRRGALPLMAAGFASGLLAGLLGLALIVFLPDLADRAILPALFAPATGALFVLLLQRPGLRWRHVLPHRLSIALVCGTHSVVAGVGLWLLAVTVASGADIALQAAIRETLEEIPAAFGSGMVGAALAGAIMELSGVRWVFR